MPSHALLAGSARAILASLVLGAAVVAVAPVPGVFGTGCSPTGALDRDGTPLTARLVDPPATVNGRVDATGCDVGVYYSHGARQVRGAEIFGARYYGVLADGNDGQVVRVDVVGASIHDIGDHPITSSRHGQGVAYRAYGGGSATGLVAASRIWHFQEAGINFAGPGVTGTARNNTIHGLGAIDTLSQNGVQVNFGAHATVEHNVIRNLRFLGLNTSNGILVAGGRIYDSPTRGCLPSGCDWTRDARIVGNVIVNADTGIAVLNADADFNPPGSPTDTLIERNVIRNDALTNLEGWDGSIGVQEGVYAYGNHDRIVDNVIFGRGYDPDVCGAAAVCAAIDTDGAVDPIVTGNLVH